jgi:hypothetical protein
MKRHSVHILFGAACCALVTGGVDVASAAGSTPLAVRAEQPTPSASTQAAPIPLVNWSAPAYFNPPHGVFTSFPSLTGAATKGARTLATFIPVPPCRLVDTRGLFNPVFVGGPFNATVPTQASETRLYVAKGNCGIPNVAGIEAVSVAVTTIPTPKAGDVEVIAGNSAPGGTVLMVMAANEWNSGTTVTPLDSSGQFLVQTRYAGATAPNPTHMAIDVNGYYTAMDPSNTNDYLSIIGNTGVPNRGLLDVVETGTIGAAVRATGPSADVRLGLDTSAVDIVSGNLRIEGANTVGGSGAVFVHQAAAANICDGTTVGLDAHYTRLTSSQVSSASADLSGLVLFVQQRSGAPFPVTTVYFPGTRCRAADPSPTNGWYLYGGAATFTTETFGVMVVHP